METVDHGINTHTTKRQARCFHLIIWSLLLWIQKFVLLFCYGNDKWIQIKKNGVVFYLHDFWIFHLVFSIIIYTQGACNSKKEYQNPLWSVLIHSSWSLYSRPLIYRYYRPSQFYLPASSSSRSDQNALWKNKIKDISYLFSSYRYNISNICCVNSRLYQCRIISLLF